MTFCTNSTTVDMISKPFNHDTTSGMHISVLQHRRDITRLNPDCNHV